MPQEEGASHGVDVIRPKCRRCSYCIQTCPAKAIKLEKDGVRIIAGRCVLCGSCIKDCPHQALVYADGLAEVRRFLSDHGNTIACLDPAFPAAFTTESPRQLVTALKRVGFSEVWEGALGADLVGWAYRRLLTLEGVCREPSRPGQVDRPIISSVCPVIVSYAQKFLPSIIPCLAPIVSPMVAIGRAARLLRGPTWRVVYLTPCLAQTGERAAPEVAGAVDEVITFEDVRRLIGEASLVPNSLDETDFDGPRPYLGRVASVGGGFSRSLGSPYDVLMDHMSVIYGRRRSVGALHQIASGLIQTRFVDLVYCDGCVDGPFGGDELSVVGRRGIVARYTETEMQSQHPASAVRELDSYRDVFLGRRFLNMEEKLPEPTEREIEAILRKIDKVPPLRNIDCRACGYASCRDKAIAVAQGMAEAEACLPYLLQQSEKIYQQLEKSHRELQGAHQALEQTQSQLIRTEKFASLGQLAAGVAHEINNPLGTITIYAHLVLKSLEADDPRREDMEVIVKEASRAKQIVQGLLSFAREAKLRPAPTDINELLEDVLGLVANQSAFHNIKIRKIFAPRMPAVTADSAQLKQVFLNIILNAAEAMEGRGTITIVTVGGKRKISVKIKDTGPGIPPEIVEKLFSPFFTTKEKGTGLGLAISYGITERHSGKIDVKTKLGEGSTFIVTLPVTEEREGLSDEGRGVVPKSEISTDRERRDGEKKENIAR